MVRRPLPGLKQLEKTYAWMAGAWFLGIRNQTTPERVMEAVRLRKTGLTVQEIALAMGRPENEEEPITKGQVEDLLCAAKRDSEAYRNYLRRQRYRAAKNE